MRFHSHTYNPSAAASRRRANGIAYSDSNNSCLVLSTDHDLKRLRKLRPSSRLPSTLVMLPVTSSRTLLPTLNELIRNVCEGTVEPFASTYVFSPRKSESLSVPVRIRVITTSAGMLTSAAPLSTTKFKVMASFMRTGNNVCAPYLLHRYGCCRTLPVFVHQFEIFSADASPCAAASRYHFTASSWSFETPRPVSYITPKIECRSCISLLSSAKNPLERLFVVLRNTASFAVHYSEIVFSNHISLHCSEPIPLTASL